VLKLQLEQKVKLYLYSELPDHKVTSGGFIPVHDPNKWIDERTGRRDGQALVIDEGNKLLILPEDSALERDSHV
jgi:hypothetical protein